MPGEFFFMGLAGLGVSFAGFAGIISALDPSPASEVKSWRLRNIVLGGFLITFTGFGTVATQTLTDDVDLTVRIVSIGMAVLLLLRARTEVRPGPAWPSRLGLAIALGITALLVGTLLVNAVIASVGLLQLVLLLELTDPATIFLNTVREIAAARRA